MKTIASFLLAGLVLVGACAAGVISEEPGELLVSGQVWFPGEGDDDLFDLGYGVNMSYREWFSFPWGVGLNAGIAQWDVDKNSSAYKWQQLKEYHGDAMLLYAGPALYFNIIDWDNWNLTLETGFQFVWVDSNVKVKLDDKTEKIDMDYGFLWHVGLEYEHMVAENMYVLAGGGYQVDVMPVETDYSAGKLRDTYLHGAFARVGLKVLF